MTTPEETLRMLDEMALANSGWVREVNQWGQPTGFWQDPIKLWVRPRKFRKAVSVQLARDASKEAGR